MVGIRSEVTHMVDFQSLDNKAHIIWIVLRWFVIVNRFTALHFKGHASMVQWMTLYMMREQVDPGQLYALLDKADSSNKAAQNASAKVKL